MNSLSKTHCNDSREVSRKFHHDDDCCEPSRKFHKEGKVALKCGTSGSATIVAGSLDQSVASLSVNTSCFNNPCTKLEFTSNVTFNGGGGANFTLSFRIFKICDNQIREMPVGPAFTFNPPTGAAATDAFTFFVCDCDSCFNDFCTFTVVVTPTGGTGASGTATITNATLAAIIVENTSKCGC